MTYFFTLCVGLTDTNTDGLIDNTVYGASQGMPHVCKPWQFQPASHKALTCEASAFSPETKDQNKEPFMILFPSLLSH